MNTTVSPSARPVLLSPTGHRPADAAMTTFSWYAPATEEARLQVSADRTFGAPLCDLPVTGMTRLTLERALPAVGQAYYWRVGRDGAWSAPAAFEAATDEQVQRWARQQAEAFARAAREVLRQREAATAAEAVLPRRARVTSNAEAILWLGPIALAYVLVVLLLAGSLF